VKLIRPIRGSSNRQNAPEKSAIPAEPPEKEAAGSAPNTSRIPAEPPEKEAAGSRGISISRSID